MTKRNRANDTLPMLGRPVPPADATGPLGDATQPVATVPLDVTDPIDVSDPTDPGPPPTFASHSSHESDTPLPSPEDAREAKALLDGFKNRRLRPPAPRPKHQPQSDGGDFVAYDAVGRPAPRTPEEAKQQALVEIARIATLPDPSTPAVARRDVPTVIGISRRRHWSGVQVAAWVGAIAAAGIVLVAFVTRGPRSVSAPPMASSPPVASAPAPPAAVVPPLSAAPAVSVPPPETSTSPTSATSPEVLTARPASAAPMRPPKARALPKEIVNW
ncbi:MAG TPA: hypothetical protein VGG39_37855 [Polyangiaceae bacterium]|jgi:hypothetical protein